MHIAICDDNIADRKQTERLLKRESDKRRGTREPFYIDGYGNAEALMRSPMLYEAFFIDMTDSEKNGYEIAMDLIHAGVTVPIVLCISKIDYREMQLPDNCLCLPKPIRVDALTDILESIVAASDNKIPHIEIRTKKETLYVLEKDIMYILTEGKYVHVHLTNGTIAEMTDTLENFYEEIRNIPSFLPVSYKTVVNVAAISRATFFHVYTKDGHKFFLHPSFRKYAHFRIKEYQQEAKP